jgi:hypothetical protein
VAFVFSTNHKTKKMESLDKKFTIENGQLYQKIDKGISTPCICPYRPPLVIPKQNRLTNQVEMDIQQPGCNIGCHFFTYSKTEKSLLLKCSKSIFEIDSSIDDLTTF